MRTGKGQAELAFVEDDKKNNKRSLSCIHQRKRRKEEMELLYREDGVQIKGSSSVIQNFLTSRQHAEGTRRTGTRRWMRKCHIPPDQESEGSELMSWARLVPIPQC